MNKHRSRPLNLDEPLINYIPQQFNIADEKDLFGLEIELEGRGVQNHNNLEIDQYWKQVKDGSLRTRPGDPKSQCTEYVFRRPWKLAETEHALSLLFNYLNNTKGVVVFESYRTSIHVHINCLLETMRTTVNFITLAMIFDELFVSQNGQTRIGNNFCLRTRDAEGQINDVINSIINAGNPFNVGIHNRYSSVNLASLSKFGTLEFRSLECTTDLERVVHWIKTIQALKVAAREYMDPREIIAKFSRKGPLGFTIGTLVDQHVKYTSIPGFHEMLHNGMRLAQDFAFCSEWVTAEKGKGTPKPKTSKKFIEMINHGIPGHMWADEMFHQPAPMIELIDFHAQFAAINNPDIPQPAPAMNVHWDLDEAIQEDVQEVEEIDDDDWEP